MARKVQGQARGRLVCDSCLKSISLNILFRVVTGEAGAVDVYRSSATVSAFILASVIDHVIRNKVFINLNNMLKVTAHQIAYQISCSYEYPHLGVDVPPADDASALSNVYWGNHAVYHDHLSTDA